MRRQSLDCEATPGQLQVGGREVDPVHQGSASRELGVVRTQPRPDLQDTVTLEAVEAGNSLQPGSVNLIALGLDLAEESRTATLQVRGRIRAAGIRVPLFLALGLRVAVRHADSASPGPTDRSGHPRQEGGRGSSNIPSHAAGFLRPW